MKTIFIWLLSSVLLQASDISLKEILDKIRYEHPLVKRIGAYEKLYTQESQIELSQKPLVFSGQGAYANPDASEGDYEYYLGLSQTFINPSVKENRSKSIRYKKDAKLLDLRYDFLVLENDVGYLYHLNCLDKKTIKEYSESLNAFETLYAKKEKAYKYGEISKLELLQLQIELDRLKNDYKHYVNAEQISRVNLQSKIILPFFKNKSLVCTDIYSIQEKLTFDTNKETLLERSLNKDIQSAKKDFSRYDNSVNSFSVSGTYQNEIDIDRYMIGLSIPLSFISSAQEKNRAIALDKQSAFEYEKENFILEKASKTTSLEKQLEQNFYDIQRLGAIVQKYDTELMPLIEASYRLGENSAIEYLLSRREMWTYKKDLIQFYKRYYETLFKLYSVVEIKEQI